MSRRIQIVTPENIEVTYELGGMGSRYVAALIDHLLQVLLILFVSLAAGLIAGAASPFGRVVAGAATGYVEALGEGITDFSVGDPVAWWGPLGSYAQKAIVPAKTLVKVPSGVDLQSAAALMVQGATAYYSSHLTFELKPGNTALVHAAAGGVGHLLTQMAKGAGATVIATASNPKKAELAREAGADEIILYTQTKFDEEVKRITNGIGLDVVYDGVGQATFEQSLKCLRPRGLLALYGAASGPVPPFDLARLAAMGSLYVTRPISLDFVRKLRPSGLSLVSKGGRIYRWGQGFDWGSELHPAKWSCRRRKGGNA